MVERLFSGVYAIVLTPFCSDGKPDYGALERQTAEAAQAEGLEGLVVCGSTGEFTRLRFEENLELMCAVKRGNQNRKQLIFGATAGDSYTAAKYIEEIQKIGADGILLAPPYYFKLADEEILAYYQSALAANEEGIPIVGYNIPQCTNGISNRVFETLLQAEQIKGFKNSWNDLQQITTQLGMRDRARPDLSYLTGLDACLYGALCLGADGIFSAISYLLPDVMSGIIRAVKDGKHAAARQLQYDVIRLVEQVNKFTFPYGYRVLAEAAGVPLGKGREAVPVQMQRLAVNMLDQMQSQIQAIRMTI